MGYDRNIGEGKPMRARVMISAVFILAASVSVGFTLRYETVKTMVEPDATKRVFILLGQSNMDGYGRWLEYPDSMRLKRNDILILRNGRWVPMVPDQQYNGPEISFAHAMKKQFPDDIISIIKVSAGGAGIRAFIPDWTKEVADISEDAYHGPLYKKLKEQIDIAKSDPGVVFCGVLWKQGEKDAIKKSYAEGYLVYLKEIISQIRKDTGVDNLPLYIATYFDVETAERMIENHMFEDREAALEITAAHNRAAEEISDTYVIRHGTLPVIRDGVHFTTGGLVTLGNLYAQEVIKNYKKGKTPGDNTERTARSGVGQ